MRIYLLFFALVSVLSIEAQSYTDSTDVQEINKVVFDSTLQRDVLIGVCDREGLMSFDEFSPFWEKEYSTYEPYLLFLKYYKDTLEEMKIIVVMGTWCGDSKREVPRFYKIMDELGVSGKNISLICVDRKKKAGDLDISDYYVEWIPVFIFMKGNKELGRIVEAPAESLENDIAQILTEK